MLPAVAPFFSSNDNGNRSDKTYASADSEHVGGDGSSGGDDCYWLCRVYYS